MHIELIELYKLATKLQYFCQIQNEDEYLQKEITEVVNKIRHELERLYSAWRKDHKDALLIEHGLWHPDGEVTKIKLEEMIIKNVKLEREVEEYKRKLMAVQELAGKCL